MKNAMCLLSCAVLLQAVDTGSAIAQVPTGLSAWDELIRGDHAIVDDERIGWRERVALSVLTPEQGRAFRNGADAKSIILVDGRSLEDHLNANLQMPTSSFVAFSGPCVVYEGSVAGQRHESLQLDPYTGCEIPQDAVALLMNVVVQSMTASGEGTRLKIWPEGMPEPGTPTVSGEGGSLVMVDRVTTVVTLCQRDDCEGSGLFVRSADDANVELNVHGYFLPISGQTPGDGDQYGARVGILSVEGASNNFFGTGAGAANSGAHNSFFGAYAGQSNALGSWNAYFGSGAGGSNNAGSYNAFLGANAGAGNMGSSNVFVGNASGANSGTGSQNVFVGNSTGFNNESGNYNVFVGFYAGEGNVSGVENVFLGSEAGRTNLASGNSFLGAKAGYSNSVGTGNTFLGWSSGFANTVGINNTFAGRSSGQGNVTGHRNVFFGSFSGMENSDGHHNAFFGLSAGQFNSNGYSNVFIGSGAGMFNKSGFRNTYIGAGAGTVFGVDQGSETGDLNTVLGFYARPADGLTNATAVGSYAHVVQSNSLVLGSIAGVNGATSNVNVGIGTSSPQRQLHLAGSNALFRMDRSADTAAFMIVRSDTSGTPLKTFVVGTNASGSNVGEFVINDLGAATGGPGARRMTVTNSGEVQFTGTVRTPQLVQTSSARFKDGVETIDHARDLVRELRGVRFVWKESGERSVGFIAEEVASVLPELVEFDQESGAAEAVNYSAIVSVLVEALKEQDSRISALEARLEKLEAR